MKLVLWSLVGAGGRVTDKVGEDYEFGKFEVHF